MRKGWTYRKLGDVCDVINGLWTGKKEPFINVAVIRNTNFTKDCKLKLDDVAYLDVETKQFSSRKLKPGDIIIEKSGGSEKQPVGRAVLFDISDGDYSFSNFTATLRIKEEANINPSFLHRCLYCHYVKGETLNMQPKTTGLHNLDMKAFLRLPVPNLSLAEQERIVVELDLLQGIIDKQKAQLKELETLAQSIFYDMFGSISERVPLSYYAVSFYGGKSLAGDEECSNKVLKTGAVTYDYFRGDDVKFLPTDYCPREEDKVRAGDLLISRMNTAELVGACAFVWDVNDNIYLPDRLWRVNLKDNANPVFIWKAMIQQQAKEQIRGLASGTSGTMKNISKPKLMSVTIPFVSISLQTQFAKKIETIEKQKILIKSSIAETQKLFDYTMDKYFG